MEERITKVSREPIRKRMFREMVDSYFILDNVMDDNEKTVDFGSESIPSVDEQFQSIFDCWREKTPLRTPEEFQAEWPRFGEFQAAGLTPRRCPDPSTSD